MIKIKIGKIGMSKARRFFFRAKTICNERECTILLFCLTKKIRLLLEELYAIKKFVLWICKVAFTRNSDLREGAMWKCIRGCCFSSFQKDENNWVGSVWSTIKFCPDTAPSWNGFNGCHTRNERNRKVLFLFFCFLFDNKIQHEENDA